MRSVSDRESSLGGSAQIPIELVQKRSLLAPKAEQGRFQRVTEPANRCVCPTMLLSTRGPKTGVAGIPALEPLPDRLGGRSPTFRKDGGGLVEELDLELAECGNAFLGASFRRALMENLEGD